ncbi:hypothetical protein AGMMS49959_03750 [Planctomycetales bacterium]|nr:hypothetical protein AGMMS49959_03750 [Planctomycetales bacterium]
MSSNIKVDWEKVMNSRAITAVTHYAPTNSASPYDADRDARVGKYVRGENGRLLKGFIDNLAGVNAQ